MDEKSVTVFGTRSGRIIGVTCSAFKRNSANEYITREIVTNSLDERLDTLINLGRAYVVLPGSTGTLLELAKVWELKNKGFLNQGKQIILVGEFWQPLVDLIAIDNPDSKSHIAIAEGSKQVIEILDNWL
jgi:predicted Rossmann-fold nucleotide-binding protein